VLDLVEAHADQTPDGGHVGRTLGLDEAHDLEA
jgi:hypothetical protein